MNEASGPKASGLRAPRVYTISPSVSFVDALAKGLMARYGADPLALGGVTILLPTRRAVKSLSDAFLRLTVGKPLLLPTMQPIGDVDEEELILTGTGLGGGAALETPPEMPPLKRQLLLTRLILFKAEREGNSMAPAQAAVLAEALGQLLDQVQTEGLSFDALENLVREEFAAHWQTTLDFLKIITVEWPKIVAEAGFMDGPARRNKLLYELATRWQAEPPRHPVIAAGSTGSVPMSAALMGVVARLPQGMVILPGLHRDMDDASWDALDASHPQFAMQQLLENHLKASRHEVEDWGIEEGGPKAAPAPRTRLLDEALRPAATTAAWRDGFDDIDAALEGLFRLDAPGPREEAGAIALMLREVLETPGRSGVLITPDRALARRVAAELGRWGIDIDDSAGQPLSQTPVGTFLNLTALMAGDAFAPVPLLSALKHPLAAGGMALGDFRRLVRRLEKAVLRGPRPGAGLDGIAAAIGEIKPEEIRTALLEGWQNLAAVMAPFARLMGPESYTLSTLLEAHIRMIEALAKSDSEEGAARLWRGEAGEVAAAFMASLQEAASGLGWLKGEDYPALLSQLMGSQTVRPRYGRHPRLNIWGPLEARLQQADLVILGGLNEGSWPPEISADPWMSRPMRAAFGLPPLERRIGLSAHDFVQAASAPRVVLTRAEKVEGTPTVPSRWLLRLDALLGEKQMAQGPWAGWYEALDKPSHAVKISPPEPRPPLSARLHKLSVTGVQRWMQDPYSLYARDILKLQPLDPLDEEPGAADRGIYIHEALDKFIKAFPEKLPPDALEKLTEMGAASFGPALSRPTVWAFWWPRFGHIANWFVETEGERRKTVKTVGTEIKASLDFTVPSAEGAFPFTLTAKADRIDLKADGSLEIIDYKTGIPPKERQLHAGYAPQLPLESVLAEAGSFEGLPAYKVTSLSFWRLTGGDPPVELKAFDKDVADLTAKAEQGLKDLVATFANPDTPYLSNPRPVEVGYGDYDHLARVKEWSGLEAATAEAAKLGGKA
jgi:ATP-dependent helicase/nuclease subunit B